MFRSFSFFLSLALPFSQQRLITSTFVLFCFLRALHELKIHQLHENDGNSSYVPMENQTERNSNRQPLVKQYQNMVSSGNSTKTNNHVQASDFDLWWSNKIPLSERPGRGREPSRVARGSFALRRRVPRANIIGDRFVRLPGSHLQRGHLSFRACVCACVCVCVLVCVRARARVFMCLDAYALFESVIHSCASPLLGPRLLFLQQWKPVLDTPLDYPAHAHDIASQSGGEDMGNDHLPPTRPHSISRTAAHPPYWSSSGGSRVNMGGDCGGPNGKGNVCGEGGVQGNDANPSRPASAYSRLSTPGRRESRNEKRETRDETRETRDEKRATRNEQRETRSEKRDTRNEKREGSGLPSALDRKNSLDVWRGVCDQEGSRYWSGRDGGVERVVQRDCGVGGWTDHVKMRQAAQEWLGAQTRIRNKLQHLLPVPHGSKSRMHVPFLTFKWQSIITYTRRARSMNCNVWKQFAAK